MLEARLPKHAVREYIQALRLLETFPLAEVTAAIEQALGLNTISSDAVRHLVLCHIERRPPKLDMANWPHLPLPRCAPRNLPSEDGQRSSALNG